MAWTNWRAHHDHEPETENYEDEIYSDIALSGGTATYGPYALTHLLRDSVPATFGPAMLLRGGVHTNTVPDLIVGGRLAPGESSGYHGGTMSDEVVALVSLILGIRLRVAGTRELSGIHRPGPPAHGPIRLEVPRLTRPGVADREYVPRTRTRTADLGSLALLESYPSLSEPTQIALARAARSYSMGLWWSNEDPNQSWLAMVSAIETVAAHALVGDQDPVDLVREYWPDLANALQGASDSTVEATCKQVARQMRATRRFVEFIVRFAPEAPDDRQDFDQVPWEEMRTHAKVIYGHRSTALHEAKPFPWPMLEWPRVAEDSRIPDRPFGRSTGAHGAIWHSAEAPMFLSTFEYIVRGALLKWWKEQTDAQ